MKVEEYIEKNVTLTGFGRLSSIILDSAFFDVMRDISGEIKDVLEITAGTGGILPPFGSCKIEGCIIVFKSDTIVCVESDGEYVDIFSGDR